jgi:hypothetical protein
MQSIEKENKWAAARRILYHKSAERPGGPPIKAVNKLRSASISFIDRRQDHALLFGNFLASAVPSLSPFSST